MIGKKSTAARMKHACIMNIIIGEKKNIYI